MSTISGIVEAAGRTNLHALPRIAWDGRLRSLGAMRVLLSGATFAEVKPTRPDLERDEIRLIWRSTVDVLPRFACGERVGVRGCFA